MVIMFLLMHEPEYSFHDGIDGAEGSDAGSRAMEELSHLRERLPEIGANAAYLLERAGLLDRQAESGGSSGRSPDPLQQAAQDEDALRFHGRSLNP